MGESGQFGGNWQFVPRVTKSKYEKEVHDRQPAGPSPGGHRRHRRHRCPGYWLRAATCASSAPAPPEWPGIARHTRPKPPCDEAPPHAGRQEKMYRLVHNVRYMKGIASRDRIGYHI